MPKKPAFIELDPDKLQQEAIDYSTGFYDRADKDAYERYGSLYPARDAAVANAAADLTGEDPMYQKIFAQSGLGPVNLGKSSYERSVNLRQPILAGAHRDRNFFKTIWTQEGKKRSAGIGTSGLARIKAAESGNSQAFGNAINTIDANAAEAEAAQNAAMIGSLVKGTQPIINAGVNAATDAASNTASYYSPSNYLNPSTYRPADNNIPFDTAMRGGTFEGTVDNMPVYRAEPVTSSYDPNSSSGW